MRANMQSVGSVLGLGAIVLTLMVRAAVDTSAQLASDAQAVDDLTGTYVDARRPAECQALTAGVVAAATPRAVTVTSARRALTLHVFPAGTTRTLRLQRRHVPINVARADGVARWRERDVVVTSGPDALPLWSSPEPPNGATILIETFSFSRSSLTYAASYQAHDGASSGKPFELVLGKCGTDVN